MAFWSGNDCADATDHARIAVVVVVVAVAVGVSIGTLLRVPAVCGVAVETENVVVEMKMKKTIFKVQAVR